MANKKFFGEVFRPAGLKPIQTGIAWTSGGTFQLAQAIDLSLPIRAIRLVLKGRAAFGTAAFTSVNPEGFLNMIQEIIISGTNARQRGNLTLWDIDLATAWVMQYLHSPRSGVFTINSGSGETTVPSPSTPFPAVGATGYINGATGTYDFRIQVDLPFHPFDSHTYGASELTIPGFLVRNEEWKDSLQVQLKFGTQAGNSTGSLGVAAATTTVAFSGYGGVGANPTIDLYSIPMIMGLDHKDLVIPGILARTSQPITGVLQAAGSPAVTLVNLQKQLTPRIYLKTGTTSNSPAFATLSDTNVSAVGLVLGGNRNVRTVVDIFGYKHETQDYYRTQMIQGYCCLDFMQSGNPDSGYPGQDLGDGTTFQLQAAVAGVANALGLVVQEQILHKPSGPMYDNI